MENQTWSEMRKRLESGESLMQWKMESTQPLHQGNISPVPQPFHLECWLVVESGEARSVIYQIYENLDQVNVWEAAQCVSIGGRLVRQFGGAL